MDRSNLLSPIIRQLLDDEQVAQGHVLVLLDKKTGDPVKGGLLKSLFNAPKRISIQLDRYVELNDQMIDVSNFITAEVSPVRYRIRLSIPSAPESRRETSARALFGNADLGSPYGIVKRFIQERLKQKIESYTSFDRLATHAVISRRQDDLARDLARDVEMELGLKADLIFDIHHSEVRDALEFRFTQRVRCRDFPRADRPIDIYLVIQRGDTAAAVAEPRDEASWKLEISRIVETAVRERVSLYEYLYLGESMLRTVHAALDQGLRSFGRKVASLQVTAGERPLFPASTHVRIPVPWQGTSGHSVNFQVEARVGVMPEGLQHFMATPYAGLGARAYEEWMLVTVKNLLPMALHAQDFTDVAAETEEALSARLAEPLRVAAQSAGLILDHFVAKPIVDAARYLTQNETIIKSQKYDTKMGPQVEFETSVLWSVRDLNLVKRFLTPQDTLKQAVSKTIEDATARKIRQFDPQFYSSQFDKGIDPQGLEFDPLRETRAPGRYAADIIREEIARDLQMHFGIAVHAIHFRQDDSLLRGLLEQIRLLPLLEVVQLLQMTRETGTGVRARIVTNWRVSGIPAKNAWAATGRQLDEAFLKTVTEQLKAWTWQLFSSFGTRTTFENIKSAEHSRDEQDKWVGWINGKMEDHFGLSVQLVSFQCIDIDSEYLVSTDIADSFLEYEEARKRRQANAKSLTAQNDGLLRQLETHTSAPPTDGGMLDDGAISDIQRRTAQIGQVDAGLRGPQRPQTQIPGPGNATATQPPNAAPKADPDI